MDRVMTTLDQLDEVLADIGRRLMEPQRLIAVNNLLAATGPVVPYLNDLTFEAAQQIGTPFSSVSIITIDQSVLIGACGGETYLGGYPVEHSYCQYVAGTGRSFNVADSLKNPLVRFQDSTHNPNLPVRAYFGTPVYDPTGWPLGSFCVADTTARIWTPDEIRTIEGYAERVTGFFVKLLGSQ